MITYKKRHKQDRRSKGTLRVCARPEVSLCFGDCSFKGLTSKRNLLFRFNVLVTCLLLYLLIFQISNIKEVNVIGFCKLDKY